MLIAPIYVGVGDCTRELCFTATSYTTSAQLVRIWAVAVPQGSLKVAEFKQFELRPRFLERVAMRVPPVRAQPYWLAILAFHRDGSAWERSSARRTGPFNVPEVDLAFAVTSAQPEPSWDAGDKAMVLSVLYA